MLCLEETQQCLADPPVAHEMETIWKNPNPRHAFLILAMTWIRVTSDAKTFLMTSRSEV